LLGVAQRTHKDWSFHNPEDKPSTTVSSGHALGLLRLAILTMESAKRLQPGTVIAS
jgi:hypothetical protein